jgi:hypothetical protein
MGAAVTWDDVGCESTLSSRKGGTHLVSRIRDGRGVRRQVRVGAPDPSLTSVSGMAAVTELVDRLGMIALLDAAVGPIKQRCRGFRGRGAAGGSGVGAAGRGGFPGGTGPAADGRGRAGDLAGGGVCPRPLRPGWHGDSLVHNGLLWKPGWRG